MTTLIFIGAAILLLAASSTDSSIHEIFFVLLAGFLAISVGLDLLIKAVKDKSIAAKTSDAPMYKQINDRERREMDIGDKPKRHLGDTSGRGER